MLRSTRKLLQLLFLPMIPMCIFVGLVSTLVVDFGFWEGVGKTILAVFSFSAGGWIVKGVLFLWLVILLPFYWYDRKREIMRIKESNEAEEKPPNS